MINADRWMIELTGKLKSHFKSKLLFVGLQGSYQRDEAHQDSDIDAVIILEELSLEDLSAYRKILLTMQESDKACGFISGRQEIMNWPKHELFQFQHDTQSYFGALEDLLPIISNEDVVDSVKIGTSGLYHLCCHTAVHSPLDIDILKDLYKSSFFILQAMHYLRKGVYIHTKKELLPQLKGDERYILNINMNWSAYASTIIEQPDFYFDLMLRWTGKVLGTNF